ncbi:MAG: glycosyltransferase family 4 protein, partial [Acidobacteriales bacterium]|nr:glycosyltransferase family 4 protein [Terriglobales bacterium]
MGRLSPEKGYSLLAAAAKQADCPLTLIGDGASREEIQMANPQAQFLGWQSHRATLQELRRARALVLPSLWYEAHPLVTCEAAAMGIPAIVSDACAGREQIQDGETGLLFRSGDQQDLVEKIELMRNPGFAARLGKEAYRRYWHNPPTRSKHVDALEACYRNVLG